jgi:hypothetical protein
MFKNVMESQIWSASDSIAVKYWKFLYFLVKNVLIFAFWLAFVFCFVICLGKWGTGIFFAVTVVLFGIYVAFFDTSSSVEATFEL